MQLPYEVRDEFLKGNLVLFIGAGFTRNYLPAMPLWHELLREVFQTLTGDPNEIYKYTDSIYDQDHQPIITSGDYLKLAQKFELARERDNKQREKNGRELIPSIHHQIQQRLLSGYTRLDAIRAIKNTHVSGATGLPIDTWITTNYDTFLDDTLFSSTSTADRVLARPIRNADFGKASGDRTLLKIHGTIRSTRPDESIIITEDDYHDFLQRDRYLINKLYTLFCERTIVFLGYSLSDPNIQFIYNDVLFHQKNAADDAPFSEVRPAFFLSNATIPEEQRAYYRHKKIRYLPPGTMEEFFQALNCVHEEFKQQRADVVAHVKNHFADYRQLYDTFSYDTDPTTIAIPPEERSDVVARCFDLIRLSELLPATPNPIPELDSIQRSAVLAGLLKTIQYWCQEDIACGSLDLFDRYIGHIEALEPRNTWYYQTLLTKSGDLLTRTLGVHGADGLARRWCQRIITYDDRYNAWEDYTACLRWYVHATTLLPIIDAPLQRDIAAGLYDQLQMCGRDSGDSWYTTNEVYTVWHHFNPAFWPHLAAHVQAQSHRTVKDAEILQHLRPGADPRKFFPRETT